MFVIVVVQGIEPVQGVTGSKSVQDRNCSNSSSPSIRSLRPTQDERNFLIGVRSRVQRSSVVTVPIAPVVPQVPADNFESLKACPEGIEGFKSDSGGKAVKRLILYQDASHPRSSVVDWFRHPLYTFAHEIVYQ